MKFSVVIRKDSEDIYYERRMKFSNDQHFIASVLGFGLGVGTILEFPLGFFLLFL